MVWLKSFPSPRMVFKPRQKEHSLPYNLPITGGRTDGFMPFQRALAQNEMQTALSRIWTQVADSISYDNNSCAKCPTVSAPM